MNVLKSINKDVEELKKLCYELGYKDCLKQVEKPLKDLKDIQRIIRQTLSGKRDYRTLINDLEKFVK